MTVAAASGEERIADPAAAGVRACAIVGPTGAGKSEVALRVAEALGAHIVSIDSMTIYRGMDIGTAKPTAADQARVPHHLLDIADPATPFSVAQFQQAARAAVGAIAARRALPLLVGGSGLYFRAVVDDLSFPPTDAGVRAALNEQDPDVLRARLRELDPAAADTVDPFNVRRVVRALEVTQITGEPFSAFRASWDRYDSRYDLIVAGIAVAPDELKRRIARRTDAMIDAGLVDEVRTLLDRGLRGALTASRAIAYGEIVAHIDGVMTLEQAAEKIRSATWQYARRQMTWFRKDPRVVWFDAPDPAAAIVSLFGGPEQGGPRPRAVLD